MAAQEVFFTILGERIFLHSVGCFLVMECNAGGHGGVGMESKLEPKQS